MGCTSSYCTIILNAYQFVLSLRKSPEDSVANSRVASRCTGVERSLTKYRTKHSYHNATGADLICSTFPHRVHKHHIHCTDASRITVSKSDSFSQAGRNPQRRFPLRRSWLPTSLIYPLSRRTHSVLVGSCIFAQVMTNFTPKSWILLLTFSRPTLNPSLPPFRTPSNVLFEPTPPSYLPGKPHESTGTATPASRSLTRQKPRSWRRSTLQSMHLGQQRSPFRHRPHTAAMKSSSHRPHQEIELKYSQKTLFRTSGSRLVARVWRVRETSRCTKRTRPRELRLLDTRVKMGGLRLGV